jgi:hypothetical protein
MGAAPRDNVVTGSKIIDALIRRQSGRSNSWLLARNVSPTASDPRRPGWACRGSTLLVAHDDLPLDLRDALAIASDTRARRLLDLMRERGWAGWTRLERLAEPPD